MIQKRYQRYTKEGITWSPWYVVSHDDKQLKKFQKEKYQLGNALRNEYRIVKECK